MPRSIALVLSAALAACGGAAAPAPPPSVPASPQLSPALAPVAWWLGDWTGDAGKVSEHWIAAGGAIYGIALHADKFEVMVLDDGDGPGAPGGVLRLYTMIDGRRSTEFRQRAIRDGAATFGNDDDGHPRTITYRRAPQADRFIEAFDGGGSSIEFAWQRAAAQPVPALEAADHAFSEATGLRGADGWVAAFDPAGGMMVGDKRVEHAEIGAAMQGLLSAGRLSWAPLASGEHDGLGYTVGLATFTGAAGADAKPGPSFKTSYVTIWRRQPDGGWKVLFDTGRTVQGL